MNVIQIMVTIIVVTILVTIVLGAGSYVAYRLRRSRKPSAPEATDGGPRFFYRYLPAHGSSESRSDLEEPVSEATARNGGGPEEKETQERVAVGRLEGAATG